MTLLAFISHIAFALAIAGLSSILTAFLVRYWTIIDVPNERSSHSRPTPRGGGIAIVSGFLAGILLIHLIGNVTPIKTRYFMGFLAGSFTIAALSLYDDLRPRSFTTKISVQLIAIAVAMGAGIVVGEMRLPWIGGVEQGWWGYYPLTLLWILGMTNAYNFMDGLDGLAASTAVIAGGFLCFITFQQGSLFIYLASLALSAAALGFLVFNLPPAKIFMGDVGSTFLGFVFAVMAVIAARYDHSHTSMYVVPLLLFHFIFDTIFTFARRLWRREAVTQAHRTHLYQLLNRLGYSHGKVTLLYSSMAVAQGLGAIWMVSIPGEARLLIYPPFFFIYLIYGTRVLSHAKRRGLL